MSVKAGTLETPERSLELVTREDEEPRPARKREEHDAAAADLRALRERIATAKAISPKDRVPHCGDCYRRGWAAALREIMES